jgi:hypothetical protein
LDHRAYLAIVKGINGGDKLTVAINKISKLVEESAAINSSKLRPLALECFARSLNSLVDVFF